MTAARWESKYSGRAPLASGCRLLGLVFAERLCELPWKFLRVRVWDAYKGMTSMEFSTAVLREVGRRRERRENGGGTRQASGIDNY